MENYYEQMSSYTSEQGTFFSSKLCREAAVKYRDKTATLRIFCKPSMKLIKASAWYMYSYGMI